MVDAVVVDERVARDARADAEREDQRGSSVDRLGADAAHEQHAAGDREDADDRRAARGRAPSAIVEISRTSTAPSRARRVGERVVRAAVGGGQQREVRELERGGRGDVRPRLGLDAPRQRGGDREHGDAGEHRDGGGRVRVLGARDERVPARVQARGGEDERERGGAQGVIRPARRTARRSRSRPRSSRPRAGPAASTLPASSAANAHAPLGSATVFARSNSRRMAVTISSSETVTTSWTSSWMTGNVSSPGIGSCWPSAIVRGTSMRDALAGRQGAHEVVARLRLDADDPRVRAERGASRSRSPRAARRRRGRRAARPAGRRPRSARAPRCPGRPSRRSCRTGGSGSARAPRRAAASSSSRSAP